MIAGSTNCIKLNHHLIISEFLDRAVKVDCYIPAGLKSGQLPDLLLINDGQDLATMDFEDILAALIGEEKINPVFCVGIHCAPDRKNEYGTANILDYKGRGKNAAKFTAFVFEELIPFIRKQYRIESFYRKAYAGFSLGGLCAMDIVWNHPQEFFLCGAFSGSFWWRDCDQHADEFDEDSHRIMQRQVREGGYYPWLKFFFEVGTKDETADRNNNGIIDSIDDTRSLITEFEKKGYHEDEIFYLELKNGKHDVETWALAFPTFLEWAYGK